MEMYGLIKRLNTEGITVIMISHDIGSAVRYAKHILHIGGDCFYGTVREYIDSDAGAYYLNAVKGE